MGAHRAYDFPVYTPRHSQHTDAAYATHSHPKSRRRSTQASATRPGMAPAGDRTSFMSTDTVLTDDMLWEDDEMGMPRRQKGEEPMSPVAVVRESRLPTALLRPR